MKMTPLVRYKNISFENFKKFLKMYPYIVDNTTWEQSFANFNFNEIGNDYNGYKKTAYQFSCQVGIENRGNNYFEVNEYLFSLDDEYIKKYLNFWILTYYAPNPYVACDDEPKIIWVDICQKILASDDLTLDYYQYFHDNINDTINVTNPTNTGNPDTLKNALLEHGLYIKIQGNGRNIYIDEKDVANVEKLIEFIKAEYPIPQEHRDKKEFFERYSFDNFSKMFSKDVEERNYQDVSVDMNNSFEISGLNFENKELIEKQINKAMKSGKHIILTGPPGTGKSKLAKQICEQYNVKYRMTTAISDWSTYETIGGYKMDRNSELYFDAGIFLSCFKDNTNEVKNEWLIIDEMNRADIDKAFGVFFSALAGDDVSLSFKDENNNNIEIVNENGISDIRTIQSHQYLIPNDWRLIGTINTLDKASLYEMSYAFMRRFAFIPISIPKNINENIVLEYMNIWGIANINIGSNTLSHGLSEIWKLINNYRAIGPAILRDIGKYVEGIDDWTSAIILYVLPQFEGIDETSIKNFIDNLTGLSIDGINNYEDKLIEFIEDFFGISL